MTVVSLTKFVTQLEVASAAHCRADRGPSGDYIYAHYVLCGLNFSIHVGESADRLHLLYNDSLQEVDIINELCEQPLVLLEWHFSEEHCATTARLLCAFMGLGVSHPALLDEAPFLNTVLYIMISNDLPPLALAQCLAGARFGFWSDDRRIFFPTRPLQAFQGLSIGWRMVTREAHDLGAVVITFVGDITLSFRFVHAWPSARFRPG